MKITNTQTLPTLHPVSVSLRAKSNECHSKSVLLLVSDTESHMRLSSSTLFACNFFNRSLILSERFSSPTLSLERSRYIFRGALHSLIQCPICPQLWHGRGSFCLSGGRNRPLSLLDWGNLSRSLAIPFFSSVVFMCGCMLSSNPP